MKKNKLKEKLLDLLAALVSLAIFGGLCGAIAWMIANAYVH